MALGKLKGFRRFHTARGIRIAGRSLRFGSLEQSQWRQEQDGEDQDDLHAMLLFIALDEIHNRGWIV